MSLLVVALLAFGAVHMVPAIPRLRATLRSLLGAAYGAAYGLASLALLVGVIAAFRLTGSVAAYDVPEWGRVANFALSLVAFICFGIFLFRGSWRNVLKFPMALGVGFWAVGHLLANGDWRSLVLFVGFAAIAAAQVILTSAQVNWVPGDVRHGHNFMSVLFGVAFYGVMAQLHGAVIGVPVVSLAGL